MPSRVDPQSIDAVRRYEGLDMVLERRPDKGGRRIEIGEFHGRRVRDPTCEGIVHVKVRNPETAAALEPRGQSDAQFSMLV